MSPRQPESVLDTVSVLDYLRSRGVVPADEDASAEPMAGGVSNEVLAVCGSRVDVVVKQALEHLKVAEEWLADPTRILAEADALLLVGALTPDDVPPVIDVDRERLILTIGRAPRGWTNWKLDLLEGTASVVVATRLGVVLARWHSATSGRPELSERFGQEHFRQLRIDPFYHWTAARNPSMRTAIDELAEDLVAPGVCLVHGDFSPKNVLTDGMAVWVLDWEVAHYGHPVFDVAFLISHLLLKAIHSPTDAERYRRCAEAFLASYRTAVEPSLESEPEKLALHTACLLLARVDGKSPVEYLDDVGRTTARALAMTVLSHPEPTIDDIWENSAPRHGN